MPDVGSGLGYGHGYIEPQAFYIQTYTVTFGPLPPGQQLTAVGWTPPFRPDFSWINDSLTLPLAPPAQYIFRPHLKSLPDRGPPPIDQTWAWRQVGMLGQDRLPFGGQIYDLAPRGPQRGLDWIFPLNLSLVTAPPSRFFSTVYDLPPLPAPRLAVYDWAWRQVGMLGQDRLPVGAQVYGLAPTAPPRAVDYGTWSVNIALTTTAAVILPRNQYDWPLPKTAAPIDQTWSINLTSFLPITTFVFRPHQRSLPDRGPPQLLQETIPPNLVIRQAVQQFFFTNSYDLPPQAALRLTDYGWTWRQVGMLGQDRLPVGEQVYNLTTRASLGAADLYTWIQSVNLALTVTPGQLPRNQYDWPLPGTPQQPTLGWSWRQVDKLGLDTLPKNQFDWPLPNRGPPQFTRSWEWRQVGMLGQDQLPAGAQSFDLAPRDFSRVLQTWIQAVNLALITPPPQLPKNQYDWPFPLGPFQPDRGFTYTSPFIPIPPTFIGAQYFLLQPHYVKDHFLDAWTTVTEGVEVPVGWIPTLMVDPLNSQAVTAFYAAGPRTGYPGPGYDWQAYQGFTAKRTAAIQSPVTHWTQVSPGQFKLTGLGTALPPVGV